MGTCQNIPKISCYHDGELPPAEAAELAAHLRQCESCRQELERLRGLSKWLSSSPTPEIPAAALGRLRGRVQPRRDRAVLRMAKTLTAAAAAVLLVCSALLWRGGDAGVGPVPPAADWERAAVVPTAPEPTALDAAFETGTEDDLDVQLAGSILGLPSMEGGTGYE
ncbi:MAG TPA: zf-HC2 domain-containing protein [Phycisphaerae bacterium]|nr:zf-HC2 domain-containing protein [Phycisphaerae bacterium]